MPKVWAWGPKSIPEKVQATVRQRIEAHSAKNYSGRYSRLDIRFRGRFCYVDGFQEPERSSKPTAFQGTAEQWLQHLRDTPIHLIG